MKKIFSILWGVAIMTLTAISCTFAFTQEQQEAYNWAYKYWLTTQPSIEAARMNSPLTRQAFAKMVVSYIENVIWVRQSASNSCSFPDEEKITKDLVPYVRKTCGYQILWTNGKNFSPTQFVERAQLWTVLSRILWWDKHDVEGKWYYIYHVNALQNAGIMNDIKNVKGVTAKRWDVLVMFKRMYEKYGSNVYLNNSNNWGQTSSKNVIRTGSVAKTGSTVKTWVNDQLSGNREDLDNEYISTVYSNSNVIYTWKNGTKYYYDNKFLGLLRNAAVKKWESDLADYLKIEAAYFKSWLDQLSNLDDEDLLKSMWIDTDNIDPENMTKQEKQELINKFRSAFWKIIDENKDRNNKLVKDLGNVVKNINKDEFWLKEKYEKTKKFMENSNAFLDTYSESIFNLMEIALNKDENDENSDEWVAQAFWLMWAALAYEWAAQEYQTYVEQWAVDTLDALGIK